MIRSSLAVKTASNSSSAKPFKDLLIPAIQTAAQQVPEEVRAAVASADTILASTNFTDRGVALMRTLSEGIRAGTHLVVEATAAATQQVRDHLPSSPAKTGPLSDIHRLKFGETIAGSIRAEPMISAMKSAASATMAAAQPKNAQMAVALAAVPSSAAKSVLPTAREARSASASSLRGQGGGDARSISVSFGDTIIQGGSPDAQSQLRKVATDERRKFQKMLEEHDARKSRKEF